MRAERRSRGGLGAGLSKAHLAGFGGLLCLLILAVFQAVRETHPDAVADRHHGATDFISRNAHETDFARHVARQATRGRASASRGDGSVVNPFDKTGFSDPDQLARQIDGAREGVPAIEDEPRRETRPSANALDRDDASDAFRAADSSETNAATRDDRFDEFPASLHPLPRDPNAEDARECVPSEYKPNHEYWGSVVLAGDRNLRDSDDACCRSCAHDPACTVWVYNPSTRECWLKSDENPKPQAHGTHVPWTSGVLPPVKGPTVTYAQVPGLDGNEDGDGEDAAATEPPACLHTVLTSSGNAYMNWQTRIMYATYKKHAAAPGSILKAFTRILHRGKDDELMMEVPTMRFDPNQAKCDSWCDYPVADRSLAIAQWSRTTDSTRCSHVMMVETDYIYVRSPSPSILLPPGRATAFRYAYISPRQRDMERVYWEYLAEHPEAKETAEKEFNLPPTGNAPTCLSVRDLRAVAPLWAEFVARTETPEETRKTLGWLRDMYAWDAAALVAGVKHEVASSPQSPLMAQPPADDALGEAFILHYTWGPEIYDGDDNKLWMFDKRQYGGGQYQRGPYKLTRLPDPPSWDPNRGLQLQTFFQPRALTESKLALIKTMIDEFNEAVDSLPRIPKGHKTLQDAQALAA